MGNARHGSVKDITARMLKRPGAMIAAIGLFMFGTVALIAGCGGGGGGSAGSASLQSVGGVAATGAPLVGQVTLRDSSSVPQDKTTTIAANGSFSVDVTGMHAPFILKATGTAEGAKRTLFSFADKPGTSNINPISTVAVANAADVDDPATVFDNSNPATLDKIKSGMPGSVNTLKSKLKVLLDRFGVGSADPVRDTFTADHNGLDGMFDNVKIVIVKGILTITNATTDAVIFTAPVRDIASGNFTDRDDDVPRSGPRPAAPTNVLLTCGGDNQLTVSWDPVANATSYDLFYSPKSNVAEQEDSGDLEAKQVRNVTSPFVLTGLTANTVYTVMVRAIADGRRSPPSTEISMTTTTCEIPTTTTTTAATTTTTAAATTTTTAGTTTTTAPATTTTSAGTTTTTARPTTTTAAPTTTTTAPATTTTSVGTTTTTARPTTTTASPTTTTTTVAPTTTTTTSTTTTTLTPSINGAALYMTNCASCHSGSLTADGTHIAGSDKQGASASAISTGITSFSSMRNSILATNGGVPLTSTQISAIATALQ